MDAKETLKYLYEHGHIISGENYKIIKNELNENARLKALLSHSKTQLEYDELKAENAELKNKKCDGCGKPIDHDYCDQCRKDWES